MTTKCSVIHCCVSWCGLLSCTMPHIFQAVIFFKLQHPHHSASVYHTYSLLRRSTQAEIFLAICGCIGHPCLNIWGVSWQKRWEKYLASGPLIGQIWCLPRRVAMTTSTTKLGGTRSVVLSCWYRSFTAWRQNERIHLVLKKRKKEKQDEENALRIMVRLVFMMWGGGGALDSLSVCFGKGIK